MKIKFHEIITLLSSLIILSIICPSVFPFFKVILVSSLSSVNQYAGLAQIFVALATIFFASWIPHKHRSEDENKTISADIYNFNCALISVAETSEKCMGLIEMALDAYEIEKKAIAELEQANVIEGAPKFKSMPNQGFNLVKISSALGSTILNIDDSKLQKNVADLILAFARMESLFTQLSDVMCSRARITSESDKKLSGELYDYASMHNLKKMNSCTFSILYSLEVLLDHLMFAQVELNSIAKVIKAKICNQSIKYRAPLSWEYNKLYDEKRLELREFIDGFNELKDRHHYLPNNLSNI